MQKGFRRDSGGCRGNFGETQEGYREVLRDTGGVQEGFGEVQGRFRGVQGRQRRCRRAAGCRSDRCPPPCRGSAGTRSRCPSRGPDPPLPAPPAPSVPACAAQRRREHGDGGRAEPPLHVTGPAPPPRALPCSGSRTPGPSQLFIVAAAALQQRRTTGAPAAPPEPGAGPPNAGPCPPPPPQGPRGSAGQRAGRGEPGAAAGQGAAAGGERSSRGPQAGQRLPGEGTRCGGNPRPQRCPSSAQAPGQTPLPRGIPSSSESPCTSPPRCTGAPTPQLLGVAPPWPLHHPLAIAGKGGVPSSPSSVGAHAAAPQGGGWHGGHPSLQLANRWSP